MTNTGLGGPNVGGGAVITSVVVGGGGGGVKPGLSTVGLGKSEGDWVWWQELSEHLWDFPCRRIPNPKTMPVTRRSVMMKMKILVAFPT